MSTKKKQGRLRLATIGGISVEQSSTGSARNISARRKRRAVHRKKLLNSQLLVFPLERIDYSSPVVMSDSTPLPALLQGVFANAGVMGHFPEGAPARKDVIKGFHRPYIPLDYPSNKWQTIIPVTAKGAERTICPMSRVNTPTQFKKGFCQRLAAARLVAGKEQAEIAKALGITPNTYSKYESRTLMPHHLIPAACTFLGVDMSYLYGEMSLRNKKTAGDLHAS
jgi:DNA-binding XRE family transcriptional regulator